MTLVIVNVMLFAVWMTALCVDHGYFGLTGTNAMSAVIMAHILLLRWRMRWRR